MFRCPGHAPGSCKPVYRGTRGAHALLTNLNPKPNPNPDPNPSPNLSPNPSPSPSPNLNPNPNPNPNPSHNHIPNHNHNLNPNPNPNPNPKVCMCVCHHWSALLPCTSAVFHCSGQILEMQSSYNSTAAAGIFTESAFICSNPFTGTRITRVLLRSFTSDTHLICI